MAHSRPGGLGLQPPVGVHRLGLQNPLVHQLLRLPEHFQNGLHGQWLVGAPEALHRAGRGWLLPGFVRHVLSLLPPVTPPVPGSITVPLNTGWNIFSTPVTLQQDNATLMKIFRESQAISVILEWNGSQWVIPSADDRLYPLYGIFVKTTGPVSATLVPSPDLTPPPSRSLPGGISIVGPAPAYDSGTFPAMPISQAFASIEYTSGGLTGYSMAISPPLNQPGWSYAKGMTMRDLLPFKGYWVVMENPDTLWGFSTTPTGA